MRKLSEHFHKDKSALVKKSLIELYENVMDFDEIKKFEAKEKKGDLRGIYFHKFKIKSLQYLLSYRMIKSDMELIMIGPHENYYKDLKSYLKRK